MPLPYNGNHKTFAKRLRREATKQENHLWYDFLKTYPVQFRRQLMIDNFIVDFYCHRAKLIIELDGSQHETDEGIKKRRDTNRNIRELRFSSDTYQQQND